MKEMMWAYLIHLGSNMWNDAVGPDPVVSFGEGTLRRQLPVYHQEMLAEREIWRNTVDFAAVEGVNTLVIDLGEGLQYESHPELAIPGAWTKDELRAELARLRSMGITPIPKLNFSACHDAWLGEYRLMRCTDTYYRVRRELIDEVCVLFDHPAYFQIGMDEENLACQRTMGIVTIRNEAQWWKDFYMLVDDCERNGARAWCWSDYYWEHPDVFARRMPKSVLQSNWCYDELKPKGPDGHYPNISYQAYIDLDRLGYDQVPTASCWGYIHNIEQTVLLTLHEKLDPERLYGFMAAPWVFTTELNRYALMDNAHKLGLCRKNYEKRFRP